MNYQTQSDKLPTLFDSPISTLLWGDWRELVKTPSMHNCWLKEDDKQVYFEANAPGVKAQDIELTLDKGVLSVKAETQSDSKCDQLGPSSTGRNYNYAVKLPSKIDATVEPKATYRDGVIKIAFEKQKSELPKKISISN